MPLAVLQGRGLTPGGLIESYGTLNASGNVTMANLNNMLVLADSTAGNLTVTLNLSSNCPGAWVFVRRATNNANTVTVVPQGADTIDGTASRTLPGTGGPYPGNQWYTVALLSSGTGWMDMFQYTSAAGRQSQPGQTFRISAQGASAVPLTVVGAAGQTGDYLDIKDSGGTVLTGYDATGRPYVGPSPSFGGGTGPMFFMSNDTADPSSNPTGGVILFSSAGVLKARTPNGTVTTIAPAPAGLSFPLADTAPSNRVEYKTNVTGDTGGYRFAIDSSGALSWGDGQYSDAVTNKAASALFWNPSDPFVGQTIQVNGSFMTGQGFYARAWSPSANALYVYAQGDTGVRFMMDASANQFWYADEGSQSIYWDADVGLMHKAGAHGTQGLVVSSVTPNFTTGWPNLVPLTIQGAPSQTGDLLDIKNSAGAIQAGIDASGNPYFSGGAGRVGTGQTGMFIQLADGVVLRKAQSYYVLAGEGGTGYVFGPNAFYVGGSPGGTASAWGGTLGWSVNPSGGLFTIPNSLSVYNNLDIGEVGNGSGWPGIAWHVAAHTGGDYALAMNATNTLLNVAPGGTISVRINNIAVASWSTTGGLSLVPTTAATVPLTIRGAASQTSDYLDIKNSAGTTLISVDPNGNMMIGIGLAGGGSANYNLQIGTATTGSLGVGGFSISENSGQTKFYRSSGTYDWEWGTGTSTMFGGGLGISGSASASATALQVAVGNPANVAFRAYGAGGQTADILQVGTNSGNGLFTVSKDLCLTIQTQVSTGVPLTIYGASGQSVAILRAGTYSGNGVFTVDKDLCLTVQPQVATAVPLTLTGMSGQTANYLTVQRSDTYPILKVDGSGNVFAQLGAMGIQDGYNSWTLQLSGNSINFGPGGTGPVAVDTTIQRQSAGLVNVAGVRAGLIGWGGAMGISTTASSGSTFLMATDGVDNRVNAPNSGGYVRILNLNSTELARFGTSGTVMLTPIIPNTSAAVGLTIQGAASQTGDYFDILNSGGGTVWGVSSAGVLRFGSGGGSATDTLIARTAPGVIQIGDGSLSLDIGNFPNGASIGYHTGSVHTTTDYALLAYSTTTFLNGSSGVNLRVANADVGIGNSSGMYFPKYVWIGANGGPLAGYMLEIQTLTTTDIGYDVLMKSGATANAFQVRDSIGNVLAGHDAAGRLFLNPSAGSPSFGGGTGPMMFLGNDTADPSTNPTGGVILFSSAGVLKARTPDGTVTQIAPRKFTQTLTAPTTAGSPYTVTHNLNSTSVLVQLWDAVTNLLVQTQIAIASANSIQVTVATNMPNNVNVVVMA